MKRVLLHIAAVSCLALIPGISQAKDADRLHSAVVDLPAVISLSLPVDDQADRPPSTQENSPSEPSYPLWKTNSTAYIRSAPADETEIVGLAYVGAELLQVGPSETEWLQVADPVSFRIGWIRSQVLSPSEERVASH
jgi:hypothetical protein